MLGGQVRAIGTAQPSSGASYFGKYGMYTNKGYASRQSHLDNFAARGGKGTIGNTVALSPGEGLFRQHFNQIGAFIDQKTSAGNIRVPAEYGQGEAYQSALRSQFARLHGKARDQHAAAPSQSNPERADSEMVANNVGAPVGGAGANVGASIATGMFGNI